MINNNKSLSPKLLVAEVQDKTTDRTYQKTILEIESSNVETSENFSDKVKEDKQIPSIDPWREATGGIETEAIEVEDSIEEKKLIKPSISISNKDDDSREKNKHLENPWQYLHLNKPGILKPSQVLLNNWKVWMAIEVVRQLKDDNFENIEDYFELPTTILQRKFEVVYRLLYEKSKKLKQSIDVTQTLPQAKALLEQYYFDIITFEVQKISQDPDITDISVMKKNLYLKVQSIKPRSTMKLMQSTANKLLIKKNRAEAEQHKYMEIEYSAFQAYMNISQKESSDRIESAWNAIDMSIKSKLRALEQQTIAQLYTDVIVDCNLYCKWAKKSLKVLEQIECSLLEKSSIIKLTFLPNMSVINVEEQQKSLERWIGHCTNHWGIAPVNWLSIEEKLLENLENIARSVFQDFLDRFMEYVIIEDEKKTNLFDNF